MSFINYWAAYGTQTKNEWRLVCAAKRQNDERITCPFPSPLPSVEADLA